MKGEQRMKIRAAALYALLASVVVAGMRTSVPPLSGTGPPLPTGLGTNLWYESGM